MNRIKEILPKFKYELWIFAALAMNFLLFFTKDVIMSDAIYPIHLVDVKAGFISRTLAGTINGILFQHPTKAQVTSVHMAITLVTFFLVALFLGGCIKKAEENSKNNLFILCLIFAVFPYGFMTFINLFELLDIYWLLSICLCLLCSDNKKAALFIPLFIILGGWSHYSFVLAFMPVIYILFFDKCIKKKNRFTYILTAVMILISVSSTIYFFTTSRTFNVISFDEFTQYILEKAGDEITHFETYCGEAFRPYDEIPYDYYIEKYSLPEWTKDASDLKRAFYGYFAFTFIDGSFTGLISDFVLATPIIAFFALIWKKAIKKTEDKKEKFLYFLCLISPLIQVIACLTSSDTSRWLSIMFISNLFMVTYLIKEKHSALSDSFNGTFSLVTKHKSVFVPLLLFYLTIVFVW